MFDPTAYFERSPDFAQRRYHLTPARVTARRNARTNALLAVLVVPDPFEGEPYLPGSSVARVIQDGWVFWVEQPVRFRAAMGEYLRPKRMCRRCAEGLPCVACMAALEALEGLGAQFVEPRNGCPRACDREHFEQALDEAGPEFSRPKPPPRFNSAAGDMGVGLLDQLVEAARVLGVQPGASRGQINAAHRAIVLKQHPDKFTNEAEKAVALAVMKAANHARDVLLEHLPPA